MKNKPNIPNGPNIVLSIKNAGKRIKNAVKSLISKLQKLIITIWKFLKKTGKNLKPFMKNIWAVFVILLLIGATQLTLLWRPIAGIYVNAAALAILIGIALWFKKLRELAISVAIIPAATMVLLSLPQTTTFAQDVVFYNVILVLGLIYRIMFTIDFPLQLTHLSIKNYAFAVALMAVAGEVLGVIGYGMLRHQYPFGDTPLPMVAATVAVFAFTEEVLFRGLIQQRAQLVMHPLLAAILPTMLFTFVSINTSTYLAPLFSLILGAVLAYTYAKKQNLILTGTINALAQLFQQYGQWNYYQ